MKKPALAVVGVGGWGKNLARNYFEIPDVQLKYICDRDEKRLKSVAAQLPGTTPVTSFETVLQDTELDAVIIAPNGPSHYDLCRRALLANKDVYVEKPFVLNSAQAVEITKLADEVGRVLMVGHLLEYHPVVLELKRLIDSGELGKIHYIYNQRLNLGTVREDENALWNFAPHDISSILFLLGKEPSSVSARGQSYLRKGIEDVVFLSMYFDDRIMANIHVSWLDPHKVRRMTIVGSKKMAVFDDLDANEKLRIYDKGASYAGEYDTFAEYLGLRFGDITIPHIKVGEPLRHECMHFVECVKTRKRPVSDGFDGVRVVRVLEAADESLRGDGAPVKIAK